MTKALVGRNLNDVAATLTAGGWTAGLDPARNSINAVRHINARWETLSIVTNCHAQTQGACLMTPDYMHRPG